MTKIINLYGGPSTGKSTYAALLFSLLKSRGLETELVTEYVKAWAWENKKPVNYDQFYLFGKQAHKEYVLFNKVDYIVTDSPMLVAAYYTNVYGTVAQGILFRHMLQTYIDMCKADGVQFEHYFLNRKHPYNPKGRFQTEEQAKQIDLELKLFMKSMGIEFKEIDATFEAITMLSYEIT